MYNYDLNTQRIGLTSHIGDGNTVEFIYDPGTLKFRTVQVDGAEKLSPEKIEWLNQYANYTYGAVAIAYPLKHREKLEGFLQSLFQPTLRERAEQFLLSVRRRL